MTWTVELAGDRRSIQKLEDYCRGEGSIVIESGRFRLDPKLFDGIDDYESVKTIAEQEVNFLNGYVRLFLAAHQEIAVGNISREEPGGPRVHYVTITERLFISDAILSFRVGEDGAVIADANRGPSLRVWLELIRRNRVAGDVLQYLLGPLDDWSNLGRILEAMEHDVGGRAQLARTGWVSELSLKRFHMTANNPSVAGPTARHGARRFQAPDDPMTISEARGLVTDIARKWMIARMGGTP